MHDNNKLPLLQMILNEATINRELLKEIEALKKERDELIERLEQKDKDNLTGLYNRNMAEEAYLKTKTAIMCDIDDFKKLNDNYGHNFGDIILQRVSKILVDNVRDSDYVIRWGGEEFILFINNHNIQVAEMLAERIRNRVESLEGELLEDGTVCPRITMSFGVARLHASSSLTEDIKEADEALYESKKSGKNNVTVSSNEPQDIGFVKSLKM